MHLTDIDREAKFQARTENPEHVAWPKIARLDSPTVVTEKIDGTNAAIGIDITFNGVAIWAQSRTRIITPDADNFGFAAWVDANAATLFDDLGAGLHFGEWYGQGIQRGYGLDHKRFALFNTSRWDANKFTTENLCVVPVLAELNTFNSGAIKLAAGMLDRFGSYAAPGWRTPEGVVAYNKRANAMFKAFCPSDAGFAAPKSQVKAA